MNDGDKKILKVMQKQMKVAAGGGFSKAEIKAMITGLEAVVDRAWDDDDDKFTVEGILGLSEDELGALFTKLNKLK